jgi:hypothetical protein
VELAASNFGHAGAGPKEIPQTILLAGKESTFASLTIFSKEIEGVPAWVAKWSLGVRERSRHDAARELDRSKKKRNSIAQNRQ